MDNLKNKKERQFLPPLAELLDRLKSHKLNKLFWEIKIRFCK